MSEFSKQIYKYLQLLEIDFTPSPHIYAKYSHRLVSKFFLGVHKLREVFF